MYEWTVCGRPCVDIVRQSSDVQRAQIKAPASVLVMSCVGGLCQAHKSAVISVRTWSCLCFS